MWQVTKSSGEEFSAFLRDVSERDQLQREVTAGCDKALKESRLSRIPGDGEPRGPYPHECSAATGPDTTREVVAFGLRQFTYDGHPVAGHGSPALWRNLP